MSFNPFSGGVSLWDREGFFENDHLKLRYLEKGKGEPVILLHGFGDAAEVWEFVLPYLEGPFRFIALDQRGHGKSDRAHLERYTTFDFISDIEALRKTLKLERLILIGHSMGGRNAIVYSSNYQEAVKKLIVIDYAPELSEKGRRRILSALRSRPDKFHLEEMAEALMEENPRLSYEKALSYLRKVTVPRNDGLCEWLCNIRLIHKMKEGKRVLRDVNLWDFLSNLKMPTLFVRGEESDLVEREVLEKVVWLIPKAQIVEISKAGHAVPLDNPEETAQAINKFLLCECF